MRIFRAGAIYAIGNIASAAVPFALLPLLTRVLTPTDFGHVIAFSLLVTVCTPFAGLGIHGAVGVAWFNRPRQDLPDFVGTALIVGICSTVATAVIVAGLFSALPWLTVDFSPLWGAAAAVTAGANILLQCRLSLWQSQQRPVANVILQFLASALNVGLSLVGVLLLSLGGEGRNGGIAMSVCLMAAIAIGLLLGHGEARWSLRRDHLRDVVLFGLPLIPHGLSGVLIGTADRWIVSAQLGTQQLGIYGAGAQLGMVMAVLADAFAKAYYPWLYGRLASSDPSDKYRVVGAIYVSIPIFLALGLCLWGVAHVASGLLLGPQYRAATIVLPWFMIGGAFTGVYYFATNLFFFSGRTSLLAAVATTSAIVGTLLIWLLISLFGLEGAAMGYAATQALLVVLVIGIAMRSFEMPWAEWRKAVPACWQTIMASTPSA